MIAVGEPAPDAAFAARDGGVVHLSDLWHERPTILLFLRHFG
jgi:peroxiredoxin